MMNRDHATAFHEAGHCVASLVLLGRATGATLFDEGPVRGVAADLPEPPPDENYTDDALKKSVSETGFKDAFEEAVFVAAGHAAVMLWIGDSCLPFRASRSDTATIDALCRQCFGPCEQGTLNAFGELAYRRALALLWPRWEGVKAVADALQQQRRLSAAEVAEAFAGAEK